MLQEPIIGKGKFCQGSLDDVLSIGEVGNLVRLNSLSLYKGVQIKVNNHRLGGREV